MAQVDGTATLVFVAVCVGSFLVGSLPFGYWLCLWLRGVDVRTVGSGNIGATNVFRCAGPKVGTLVLILDVAKGYVPSAIGWAVGGPNLAVAAGALAVLGHTFSPFLRFRGGKGVATALGLLVGVAPVVAGLALLCFAVVFAFTRWVSLSSVLAAALSAFAVHVLDAPTAVRGLVTVIAVVLVINHRGNIRRLLRGEEPKFRFGGPTKKLE